MHSATRHNQRGFVLASVVVLSVVIAAAAFAILVIATSKARLESHLLMRTQARLAAEAAVQDMYARLWVNPALAPGPYPVTVGAFTATCTVAAGVNRAITCTVTF